MKLVSYVRDDKQQLAILWNDFLYRTDLLDDRLPDNMLDFLKGETTTLNLAKKYAAKIQKGEFDGIPLKKLEKVKLLAPLPNPTSTRDAYAFRQHVETARQNRGVEMIPEFDQFPIFYFTNHNAIFGPGIIECMPDHFKKLDFELEVAIIIGKKGRNILAKDADEYIAGFTIMNDFSARQLQMEEMKFNLGPAKGKDFATSIGPYCLTTDELKKYLIEPKEGHTGNAYNLKMTCKINDEIVAEGSLADMDWTFAEIIERASYGTDILPGDLIGSGTVGTGCFLELNGTALRNDPKYMPRWLVDGDHITLEVEGLGSLTNTIKKSTSEHSILALKKNKE